MADELRRRSPRARLTREQRKAQTRSRLLESAHTLIALRGFEGASIDEIAADAGYTRGAFYSNFANKEAIMEALIATGFDTDIAGVSQIAGVVDLEQLTAGYREMARQYAANPENTLWSLEFQLAAVRHPDLRPGYAEQFNRLREGIGSLLVDTYKSLGHPTPEETARFSDVLIVILTGLSLMKLLYPDTFDEQLFEDAFVALIRGIPEVNQATPPRQ